MVEQVIRIASQPGIKRDGTRLEGDNYVDGQWVRFQRGLPRKIGGYRSINKYLTGLSRTLHAYTRNLLTYVHSGSANTVERFYIDGSNNTSVISDRTPTTLTESANNLWQFDVDTAAGLGGIQLIAQVAPNLECICNSVGGQLFYGDLFGTGPLAQVTNLPTGYDVTGGVVALHPYTVAFGSNGYVMWSTPGDPTDYTGLGSGAANVTGQKIVRGLPLRGGGSGPSGLLWSADSLIRMSFVGGDAVWAFDTISASTSVLSPSSVIEYDGVYYWIATDRFVMFNGVVRDIENNLNINFFFDNLNGRYRQKVFAFKVPRFGEIWWCFPKGDSTEPNHAVIYNVRENSWYDTALPDVGRSAAVSPTVFSRPLATSALPFANPIDQRITEASDHRITETLDYRITEESGASRYKLWVHEIGTDEVDGQDARPIKSYFETADIAMPISQGANKQLQVLVVEPDFVQSGPMSLTITGRVNARAPEQVGPAMVFQDTAATPYEQIVPLKEQRREMRFRFESDTLGGDYQMGAPLAHVRPGDGTVLG